LVVLASVQVVVAGVVVVVEAEIAVLALLLAEVVVAAAAEGKGASMVVCPLVAVAEVAEVEHSMAVPVDSLLVAAVAVGFVAAVGSVEAVSIDLAAEVAEAAEAAEEFVPIGMAAAEAAAEEAVPIDLAVEAVPIEVVAEVVLFFPLGRAAFQHPFVAVLPPRFSPPLVVPLRHHSCHNQVVAVAASAPPPLALAAAAQVPRSAEIAVPSLAWPLRTQVQFLPLPRAVQELEQEQEVPVVPIESHVFQNCSNTVYQKMDLLIQSILLLVLLPLVLLLLLLLLPSFPPPAAVPAAVPAADYNPGDKKDDCIDFALVHTIVFVAVVAVVVGCYRRNNIHLHHHLVVKMILPMQWMRLLLAAMLLLLHFESSFLFLFFRKLYQTEMHTTIFLLGRERE